MNEAILARLRASSAARVFVKRADELLKVYDSGKEGGDFKNFENDFTAFLISLHRNAFLWKPAVLVDMLAYICARYPQASPHLILV